MGSGADWQSVLAMAFLAAYLPPPLSPAKAGETKSYAVEATKDVAYFDGPDQHKIKHKLDLYLPKGAKDFPVLFFVHGGAWMHGDKNQFGIYSSFANSFAKQGIGVVVTNYRLSPGVTHPEHIKDIARAFAWTVKNIGKHGGNKDCIFLSGHSAGAHLVALLATDPSYLKPFGLTSKAIRGVLPISGPFVLSEGFLPKVFGADKKAAPNASPIAHARKDLPPFLIFFADSDFIGCDRKPATAFCKALKDKGTSAEAVEIVDHNHFTILMSAGRPMGKVHQGMVEFIRKHSAKEAPKADGAGR